MQFRSNFGDLDKDITNMKIFLGFVNGGGSGWVGVVWGSTGQGTLTLNGWWGWGCMWWTRPNSFRERSEENFSYSLKLHNKFLRDEALTTICWGRGIHIDRWDGMGSGVWGGWCAHFWCSIPMLPNINLGNRRVFRCLALPLLSFIV